MDIIAPGMGKINPCDGDIEKSAAVHGVSNPVENQVLSCPHVEELKASAVSSWFALEAGVATVSDAKAIARDLNWSVGADKLGACLTFAYFDIDGKPMTFHDRKGVERQYTRKKPTTPRRSKKSIDHPDGRVVKYEAPAKVPPRLYIPLPVREKVVDAGIPLIITEGEKKALAAAELGFAVVALPGVWSGFRKADPAKCKGTPKQLMADFDLIILKDRFVIFIFDSDAATNPSVQSAEQYLVEAHRAIGAKPIIVRLPNGVDGKKVGIDDFIVAKGALAFSNLVSEAITEKPDGEKPKEAGSKVNAATVLLKIIVTECELWHDDRPAGYASIGRKSMPIESKAFRQWLNARYYELVESVPAGDALTNAINSAEGLAVVKGKLLTPNVRFAGHDGKFYFDLADGSDTVIEIGANDWNICELPPVKFVRAQGQRALPMPKRCGSIEELRGLLNIPADEIGDDLFLLTLAWLCGAFLSGGPFPIAVLSGEMGSGKTTFEKILKVLIDPTAAPIRSEPKDARDFMIAARNSGILAYDNLGKLSVWFSDALCRLATGGGFSTRTLYSDSDEMLFDAKRPAILNGIEDIVSRGDLLERSILLRLRAIGPEHRRTEAEIWSAFKEHHACILGGLLDRVAKGLAAADKVKLEGLPRMADFVRFAVACEGVTESSKSKFLKAYLENQVEADAVALDDPLTEAVLRFMAGDKRDKWEGSASDLISELDPLGPPDPKPRSWPKTASALSNRLIRLAPNLRKVHRIHVERGRENGGNRKRTIRFTRNPGTATGTTKDGPQSVSSQGNISTNSSENASIRDSRDGRGDDSSPNTGPLEFGSEYVPGGGRMS
jgi:hypothetical protein